jgi:hypothetical protein
MKWPNLIEILLMLLLLQIIYSYVNISDRLNETNALLRAIGAKIVAKPGDYGVSLWLCPRSSNRNIATFTRT